jgi:hypothetical protein
VKVSLADLRSSLGPGWRRLDYDVNGEWGFYLTLDQFLKSVTESKRAAAGWAGDRYVVYENRRGQVTYISLSAWDTEKDAREFFDAYVKRSELRYPKSPVVSATSNTRSIRTVQGDVFIELRGKRVLVVEGLPLRARMRLLTHEVWAG